MTDKQQLLEAFRSAKGIVDHEFSQEVIDASREADEARQQRILNGETTFLNRKTLHSWEEWRKSNPK